ncbi:hypothetical protein COB11_04775 [Candidatus Aerophobetes bacterium]|uniref:Leucine-rich repeat domain-containing protein n=1 Tax=Aerophobetes bacterium TaxID=2030807 RepID=A0A2A4YGR0_UNCAE|nr:MAG: hypothetical protein COB11_04775 [Candidatus Aerophobetes bacterium]
MTLSLNPTQPRRRDDEFDDKKSVAKIKDGTFLAENDPMLHALPVDLRTDLVSIKVNGCSLRFICSSVQNMTHLTELYVTNCKLQTLPEGMNEIPLETLVVSGNAIQKLPVDLFDSMTLKVLDVSSNVLRLSLPISFGFCVTLKDVNLSDNNLTVDDFPSLNQWDADFCLDKLCVDQEIIKETMGVSPLPVQPGGLEGLRKDRKTPHSKKIRHHSDLQSTPSRTRRARVKFATQVQVARVDESSVEETTVLTEFVVEDLKTLHDFCQQSQERLELDGTGGFMSKVSHILMDGVEGVETYLPFIKELASGVRIISLRNCKIGKIPDDFFEGMHSIKTIDFSHNNLLKIPSSFSLNKSIQKASKPCLFELNWKLPLFR